MVDALVRLAAAGAAPLTLPARRGRKTAVAFASMHDQWLHALRDPDGILTGSAAELESTGRAGPLLAAAHRRHGRVRRSASAFASKSRRRTGDGHKAPETDGEWQVRYLLQAADDPSLLVPVADAWTAKGR